MLQKFKNVFPWVLIVSLGMMVYLKDRENRVLKDNYESIIDSLKSNVAKEESLVDSFYVLRTAYQEAKDSALTSVDTMGLIGLQDLLKQNIGWYESYKAIPYDTIYPVLP